MQQKAGQGEQGAEIARNIVMAKIKNQLNLMKFYGRSRPDDTGFQKALDEMKAGTELLVNEAETLAIGDDRALFRDRLFSVEGRAAAAYWDTARRLLPEGLAYPGRKRQGASDLVNSLLNYGYGMLYGRVHGAVATAGLNPETSFLHALEGRRPSLVFDLIEEFRSQAVDRAVFTMFTRGEELSLDKKTGLIDDPTKKKLIANVLERLGSLTPYRGKKIRLEEIISLQAKRLRECIEKKKSYRPFVGRY